ncbi:hypothetical protein BJY52DRAFT_1190228 [Lactarius psammicola]|nr:hypothetical protein BJY52DRAFT_1190228 [Lactarius psammicola]
MTPVVLLKTGPHAGHIAVISEIIDHNRAIIDGRCPTPKSPAQCRLGYREELLGESQYRLQMESSAWAKKRTAAAKR